MPRTRTRISIGDARSLNWRTHVLFAVPALLSAVFFDFDRLGGNPGLWLLLSVIGLGVTIGVIEGLTALTKKRQWQKPRAWAVVLILLAAGFSRGATLFFFGGFLGIVPETDLTFRLVGGPIFVVSIYFLVDTMVSSFLTHQDQAASLTSRRLRLQLARAGFEKEMARLTEAQRAQVRELVAPSVWELQKFLSAKTKNVQDAIFQIKSLNETVVRPLSQQMSGPEDVAANEAIESDSSGRIDKGRWLPSRVSIYQSLNLGFFALVALILGFNSQSAALGAVSAVVLLLATLPVVLLAVWAFKLAVRGLVLPTWIAVFVSVSYGAVVGYLSGTLTTLLGLSATDQFALQSALFVSINMLFTLGLGVATVEREKSLEELEAAVEEYSLLNSRLRQQVWLARKTLAMELHGSIQSTLQSVAARLSKLKDPSDKELDQALAQVREAFARVDKEDYLAGKSLQQLLDELVLLWEGALDVQIEMTERAKQDLEGDQAAARCALEVCREATTNAVKHGSAEQVKISITDGENFVLIKAVNDGINLTQDLAGQGINLYREVAHAFSLTDQPEGVTLELQLPLNVRAQP
jgi:signal transduction histidine kinase